MNEHAIEQRLEWANEKNICDDSELCGEDCKGRCKWHLPGKERAEIIRQRNKCLNCDAVKSNTGDLCDMCGRGGNEFVI